MLKSLRMLKSLFAIFFLIHPMAAFAANSEKSQSKPMQIAGYVENVTLYPEDLTFSARMDTGATTSSLNALNQKRFKRQGAEWIRFDVTDPKDENKLITLEREIVRNVRIKRHSGKHQRRPVVRIGFCVGTHYREEDVSLQDRTQLNYQLLVGRNHMREAVLVDSSKKHLLEPKCQKP